MWMVDGVKGAGRGQGVGRQVSGNRFAAGGGDDKGDACEFGGDFCDR